MLAEKINEPIAALERWTLSAMVVLLNGMVSVNSGVGFGLLEDNYTLQLFNEGGERKEGITCFFLNMSFCFRTDVPEIIYYWKKYFFHFYGKTLGEFRLLIRSFNISLFNLLCFLW